MPRTKKGCGEIVNNTLPEEISIKDIKKDLRRLRKILKEHKINESGVKISASIPKISIELKNSVNNSIKKSKDGEKLTEKEYEDLIKYNEILKDNKLPTVIKKRELIKEIVSKKFNGEEKKEIIEEVKEEIKEEKPKKKIQKRNN